MVDPFTARKRSRTYSSADKYTKGIALQQTENKLNSIQILRDLSVKLNSVERNSHLSPRQKAFFGAVRVSDKAAEWADIIIDAEIKAEAVAKAEKEKTPVGEAKKKGMEVFEALPPEKRKQIWDEHYEHALQALSKHPKVASNPAIKAQIQFLGDFFRLPKKIHIEREHHTILIRKLLEESKKGNPNPKEGLRKQLDKRLAMKSEKPARTAMHLCVAVSIYADIMAQRGAYWPDAYMEGMKEVYYKINRNEPLLDAIAAI